MYDHQYDLNIAYLDQHFTHGKKKTLIPLDFMYSRTSSPLVSSSAASTISPNDDDEGLYLLWTHQLLRERGYKPSSCNANDDDDDNESVDSSISDLSVDEQRIDSASAQHYRQSSSKNSTRNTSHTSSWLSSCFPMC